MKNNYTSYQRGALQFSLAVIIAGAMAVGTFLYNKVESLIKNPAPAPVETTQVQPPTAFVQPSAVSTTVPASTQTPTTSTPQVTPPTVSVIPSTTTPSTTCTTGAQCFSLQTTNNGSSFMITTDTQQLCNVTAGKLLSTLTKITKETLTIADIKLYACTTTPISKTTPLTTTTSKPVTYDNMDAEGTVGDGQNSIAVSSITATTMTGTITHDSTKQVKSFTLGVNSSISIFGYSFTLTKITTNSDFPGQYVGSMTVVQVN